MGALAHRSRARPGRQPPVVKRRAWEGVVAVARPCCKLCTHAAVVHCLHPGGVYTRATCKSSRGSWRATHPNGEIADALGLSSWRFCEIADALGLSCEKK